MKINLVIGIAIIDYILAIVNLFFHYNFNWLVSLGLFSIGGMLFLGDTMRVCYEEELKKNPEVWKEEKK